MPAQSQAEFIYKIAEVRAAERDLPEHLLVHEQGKTRAEAGAEFTDIVRYLTYSAEDAGRMQGETFPSDNARKQGLIQRVTFGVTLGLCAHGYPMALIGRKAGADHDGGCAVAGRADRRRFRGRRGEACGW